MSQPTQPYNPSAYLHSTSTTNAQSPQKTKSRAWQFSDYEDSPIAYIFLPDSKSNSNTDTNPNSRNTKTSRSNDDTVLRDILRKSGKSNTNMSNIQGKNGWERYVKQSYNIGIKGKSSVNSGNRGVKYHESVRNHTQQPLLSVAKDDVISAKELFAQKMGFKYKRDFDDWARLKDSETVKSQVITNASKAQLEGTKKKRELDCINAFNDWMIQRGSRKIELVRLGCWVNDDDVKENVKDSPTTSEKNSLAKHDKPWRRYVKSKDEKNKEAEAEKIEVKLKNEEDEGRRALAEGVFLEWLAIKDLQVEENKRKVKLQTEEREVVKGKEREEKWLQNVVVCCYSGEEAKGIRKGVKSKVKVSFREMAIQAEGEGKQREDDEEGEGRDDV